MEIFNTDQGSQFTSDDFIKVLKSNGIKVSMDGVGRALDYKTPDQIYFTNLSKQSQAMHNEFLEKSCLDERAHHTVYSIIIIKFK